MAGRRVGCNFRSPLALRTTGIRNYLRLPGTTSLRIRSPWLAAEDNHISLKLGCAVEAFSQNSGGLKVHVSDGEQIETDIVLLAIGVTPASELAQQAGLEVGSRGGIIVSDTMQTSDSIIWAVGDVVEVEDFVSKQKISVPLAGPATRQGRIAAGAILEFFNSEIQRNLRHWIPKWPVMSKPVCKSVATS